MICLFLFYLLKLCYCFYHHPNWFMSVCAVLLSYCMPINNFSSIFSYCICFLDLNLFRCFGMELAKSICHSKTACMLEHPTRPPSCLTHTHTHSKKGRTRICVGISCMLEQCTMTKKIATVRLCTSRQFILPYHFSANA